jgi:FKBP-type peptidyl-prolyl cis-trans isomerase
MPLTESDAAYTTTDSGLQYRALTEGAGDKPTADNIVTVHYTGCFEDGGEFDSSHGRGEPTTFPLGGVIAGWTEGLQLMAPGAKYQFIIPHGLAYGEGGMPGAIPARATLHFEVDLISFE